MRTLAVLAIALFAAYDCAAQYATPPANPVCVVQRNCTVYPGQTRYVAVHQAGYLYPTSAWTPADSGLILVPFGTRLEVIGVDDSGGTIYVEHEGVRGWMLSVFTSASPQTATKTSTETNDLRDYPISVYPNPAPGRVTIEGEGSVYDALGRRVRAVRDEQVDLSPGSYFFRSGQQVRYFVVI